MLAQIANWLILAAIIIAVCFLVGRDARRRGHSWPATIAWAYVSVSTFPIGLGLSFLLRRRKMTAE